MRTGWRAVGLVATDWAVPLGFGVGLSLAAPLQTALVFGGNEGYELMKALLVSLGHPLYGPFWNDQPPLHTELVAWLFRLVGPSAYAARLLSVGFAVVLVGAFYRLVSARSGRAAGLVAVALVVVSPHFLELSVSVMLDGPSLALGVAALWAWDQQRQRRALPWALICGLLFGCALQIKLTAAILAPALAVECFLNPPSRGRRGVAEILSAAGCWAVGVTAAFGLIALAFYRHDTLAVFWASHFSAGTTQEAAGATYEFRPEAVVGNAALVPALAGFGLIMWRRRRDLILPVVLLGTASLVHWWHRPFWYYYSLHFAVPLAWLGAVGVVEGFVAQWDLPFGPSLGRKLGVALAVLSWSLVVAWPVTLWPGEVGEEVLRLRQVVTAASDGVVMALQKHAAAARWIFTDNLITAFWARVPVPPELAVIPLKRVWSGQISGEQVKRCLERYRPELVLIGAGWQERFGLQRYLAEHYTLASDAELSGLYVRNGWLGPSNDAAR